MRGRIGSMFTGYGGLDMAVAHVTGGEVAFVADVCGDPKTKHWPHRPTCKAPCALLAHRYPDVPNLGDVTTIDWTSWAGTIDVLCAGFPCQDVSTAGKRAGLRDGTRTGLWSQVVRAIVELSPRLVVLENVPGIFTAPADGDVEPCSICLGDGADQHLRALHAVLADLAEIGFDAEWVVVPAAGVGAPHKWERWFLTAHPRGERGLERWLAAPGEASEGWALGEPAGRGGAPADLTLLPTPRATDGTKGGPNQRGSSGDLMLPSAVTLLPTPAVNDMGAAYTPEQWDDWTDRMREAHGNGNGHGKSLHVEALRLLPTPMVGSTSAAAHGQISGQFRDQMATALANFGDYAAAVARWESVIGRPAPAPTEPTGKGGAHRLSPRFTEWMMGLPDGWITDVPGITRNEALKLCGNGVIPQQAVAALTHLLERWVLAA